MSTEQEKWSFLDAAPARDAQNPALRQLAAALMWAVRLSRPPNRGELVIRYAEVCLTVARDWIRYETDTDRVGHEDIAGFTRAARPDDAVDALWRGVDDCDAKARIFVALCLAGGVQARMVPHWHAGQLAHVSAVFTKDGTAWIPVETTLTRARIGDTPTTIPKETETGKWQTT
jgi:transglutaminase-like putative cysteine protease